MKQKLWLVERTLPDGRKFEVFRWIVMAAEREEAIGTAQAHSRNDGEWCASLAGERVWQLQTTYRNKKEVEAMRQLHAREELK